MQYFNLSNEGSASDKESELSVFWEDLSVKGKFGHLSITVSIYCEHTYMYTVSPTGVSPMYSAAVYPPTYIVLF